MSVEAICWALNLPPVPAGRGRQLPRACKSVLAGLANHAGPEGTSAFPSVAMLVCYTRYTRLSERTVGACLDRLAAGGIISPCDPGIVATRIKRADRRPQGWDLNLSPARHDLDDDAVAVFEHQFPGLGGRLAVAAQPGADGLADGVHQRADGVQTGAGTGCSGCTPTVQRNRPGNPPPKRQRARVRPQPVLAAAVGWSVSSSPPWIATGG